MHDPAYLASAAADDDDDERHRPKQWVAWSGAPMRNARPCYAMPYAVAHAARWKH